MAELGNSTFQAGDFLSLENVFGAPGTDVGRPGIGRLARKDSCRHVGTRLGIALFSLRTINRVPVVDGEGRLGGIVSRSGLIAGKGGRL